MINFKRAELRKKSNLFFFIAAFEISDFFQVFFDFINDGSRRCSIVVFFMSFTNIFDNSMEIIRCYVAEIFIFIYMS